MSQANSERLDALSEQYYHSAYFSFIRSILGIAEDDFSQDKMLDEKMRRLVFKAIDGFLPPAYTDSLRAHVERWPEWKSREGKFHQNIYHHYLGINEASVSARHTSGPLPKGSFFRLHFCVPEEAVAGFGDDRREIMQLVGPRLLRHLRVEREGGGVPELTWHDLLYLRTLPPVFEHDGGDEVFLLTVDHLSATENAAAESLVSRIAATVQEIAPGSPRKSRRELGLLWTDWKRYFDVLEDTLPGPLRLEAVV